MDNNNDKLPKVKIEEGGIMPRRATDGSAGYDLYVPCDTRIEPRHVNHGRNLVPLQIRLEVPSDCEGLIDARSGFSARGMEGMHLSMYQYLQDANGGSNDAFLRAASENMHRYDADVIQGKIDSDYRGIINVIVKSNESFPFMILAGTRIAQITFVRILGSELQQVDQLNDITRAEGGFGHTGTGIISRD